MLKQVHKVVKKGEYELSMARMRGKIHWVLLLDKIPLLQGIVDCTNEEKRIMEALESGQGFLDFLVDKGK